MIKNQASDCMIYFENVKMKDDKDLYDTFPLITQYLKLDISKRAAEDPVSGMYIIMVNEMTFHQTCFWQIYHIIYNLT